MADFVHRTRTNVIKGDSEWDNATPLLTIPPNHPCHGEFILSLAPRFRKPNKDQY